MIKNNSMQIFTTERDYFENMSIGGGVVKGDGDTVNTYGYSDGIAKISVDNENRGWFMFRQDGLKVGDIIEVECEIRVVNGNYPKMRIYKGSFNNTGLLDSITVTQDEWGVVRHKHIVEDNNNYYIGVGFDTADVGKAEFRNFAIEFITNAKPNWENQSLSNGWTNLETEYDYPLQYKMEGTKVTVRGNILQTTNVANTTITTFPANISPTHLVYAIALQKGGSERIIGIRVHRNGRFEVVDGVLELDKLLSFYFSFDID